MTQQFKTNLNCAMCVRSVTNFLNEVPGVENWQVDTDNPEKTLTVEGSASADKIMEAVDEAGFDITLKKD